MESYFEEMFGEIVGEGAQATVYAKGDVAVKLYKEGYPKENVFSEAYIMANLERVNFPSPKIYEVLLTKGRYALRMERVKGKVMSELGNPEKFEEILDILVDLQCRLQKYDQAAWAPELKQRFRDDLERNTKLSPGLKKKLRDILHTLPEGNALCHCDFHSGNVFFDGKNYTIIDLLQISRGAPEADAACSYMSYRLVHEGIAEAYLDRYCRKSGLSRESIHKWLTVYAGTMLGQVPEHFTPIIEQFLPEAE